MICVRSSIDTSTLPLFGVKFVDWSRQARFIRTGPTSSSSTYNDTLLGQTYLLNLSFGRFNCIVAIYLHASCIRSCANSSFAEIGPTPQSPRKTRPYGTGHPLEPTTYTYEYIPYRHIAFMLKHKHKTRDRLIPKLPDPSTVPTLSTPSHSPIKYVKSQQLKQNKLK